MNPTARKKVLNRMNRIAGQVGGVHAMVQEDRYCLEILDQIASIRVALDRLGIEILTDHLENCVLDASGENWGSPAKPLTPDELSAEVRAAMKRFLK